MRFLPTRPERLAARGPHADRGFMMVAILIGMGVAAIMMTAALPSWRQQVQRTREEELIFRGQQYARALALYALKNRGGFPMEIDVLISQHYLRKKWKDPITGKDFQLVGIGIVQPGVMNTPVGGTNPQPAGTGRSGGASQMATTGQPGISGVRSTSTATSIKVYNQQQQHNLWAFDAVTYAQQIWQINLQQVANGQQGQQGGRQGGGPGGQQGGQQGGGIGPRGGGGPGRGDVGGAGPGRGGGAPVPPPGGAGPGRGRGF